MHSGNGGTHKYTDSGNVHMDSGDICCDNDDTDSGNGVTFYVSDDTHCDR